MLCDRLLNGAKEAGHETEKINLANMRLSPCRACYGCGKSGKCVIDDDMAAIQQRLIDADVIVLATPVYFYCMDAQLKMMIDRCLPRYREMKDKRFVLITASADPGREAVEGTLAGMRGFLACLPGSREESVICGSGAWEKGDILRHPAMESAYLAGKALANN